MNKMKYVFVVIIILSLLGCVTTSNILSETNNQGLLISSNELNVKLMIPSRNLVAVNERGGGGQSNPNYFYFVDKKVNGIDVDLHFSGWLEPIEKFRYNNAGELWAYDFRQMKFNNPEFRKTGNWEVFLYDVPVPEGFRNVNSSHMRANLLYDDTWIDLHLSITDMKSSEFLHNVLFEYLKTVQVIK